MSNPLKQVLKTGYKKEMIAYVHANPSAFDALIQLSLTNEQPLSKRAAWVLWDCMNDDDVRIQPYLSEMIVTLKQRNESQQRELLKVIGAMKLTEDEESRLFDICCTLWETISLRPSVRYMAFMALLKIAKKYPELKNEIHLLAQPHYLETLSPGIHRAVKKRLME